MKERTKDNIISYGTLTIVILVVVVGVVNLVPVLRRSNALKQRDAALIEEIASVNAESAEYSDRARRFQSSSEQVESIARQDHRVYPGEVVFVFPEKK